MPLRRMPNGAYVNVPEDVTPEGFAKIAARYKAKAGSAPAATASAPKAKIDYRDHVPFKVPGLDALDAFTDNAAHAVTFGADDVVGPAMLAATQGAYRAARKGDVSEIGRTYSNARREGKLAREERSAGHGIASGAGTVAGIFGNPVGASLGLVKAAGAGGRALSKAVPAAAPTVARAKAAMDAAKASGLGQVVSRAGGSSIGVGARAGANQSAITALMDGKSGEDILNEGATGALYGGAASALLRGGSAVARTIRNQAPDQANRVAMERIAAMLERSEDPLTKKPLDAAAVQREIRATDKGGGDAILADLTPEGQGWASYLAKQPGNKAASGLINQAEERASGAADRFNERVRKQLGITPNAPDAYDMKQGITASRKAAGSKDYSDDVMDRQLAWNDDLEKIFKGDNPAISDALPHAEKMVRIDGGDVQQLAFSKMNDPKNATMTKVPSMRTMQYVTQALDTIVSRAMREGDANLARAYSKVNRELKDAVAKANPEFAAANATQRDFYEQENSVKLGQDILKKLRSNETAREVLDMIKAGKIKPDDLKIGFADALMDLQTKPGGDNPVALMRRFMRSGTQRKVLAHMFGGNKNLNEFERFMRRELRGSHTDSMVSSGRQMQANLLKEPSVGGDVETMADIGKAGLQGAAFGGPMGAVSRMISSAGKWGQFLSPSSKVELSRILSSKGEGLEAALKKLQREALRAKARGRKASETAGKLPSAVVGGYSEQ